MSSSAHDSHPAPEAAPVAPPAPLAGLLAAALLLAFFFGILYRVM
jgi:hypothetical protein